jgi:transposase InsO family protein
MKNGGTDITWIKTQKGYAYLAIVKDFFDGSIQGYAIAREPSTRMVLKAVRAACDQSTETAGVILQSDQGAQFQSSAYHHWVQKLQAQPSMSRSGNCLDNAPTESFFSYLKLECIYRQKIRDYDEAVTLIEDYIDFYNHERIQLKTMLTPMEFRRQHL